MNDMSHFAKTVATKRKEKNLTQEGLATRLGISPQAVSKWENGLGLPDVTLFPLIAQILEVSLAELFGVEEKQCLSDTQEKENHVRDLRVPKEIEGLPLAGIGVRRACYSKKPVVEQKDEKIFFGDGSEADLVSGWSTNCGSGDIRIYKIDEIGRREHNRYTEPADFDKLGEKEWSSFSPKIQSLYFSIHSGCHLRILKGEGDSCKLHIKATKRFLNATTVETEGETLTVRVKNLVLDNWMRRRADDCEITLSVPFKKGKKLHVSLYGMGSATVESDFEEGELKIEGSGSFAAASFEKSLTARIGGSGLMRFAKSLGDTKLRISGSGKMELDHINNADIKISGSGDICAEKSSGKGSVQISGSGDVNIDKVSGELRVKISGSGDLTCGGVLDFLSFTASGSGDLKGAGLTVKDAELHTVGNADIEIGRITGSSKEKFSKHSSVKIGLRG